MVERAISSTLATILLLFLVILLFSGGFMILQTLNDSGNPDQDTTEVSFTTEGINLIVSPTDYD